MCLCRHILFKQSAKLFAEKRVWMVMQPIRHPHGSLAFWTLGRGGWSLEWWTLVFPISCGIAIWKSKRCSFKLSKCHHCDLWVNLPLDSAKKKKKEKAWPCHVLRSYLGISPEFKGWSCPHLFRYDLRNRNLVFAGRSWKAPRPFFFMTML